MAASLRARLAAEPDGPSVGDRLARFLGVGDALGADTAWAVRRLLEVLAAEQPVVVVLEDVHWAEPPMLDLVDAVIEHVHGHVLFLCLARPELLEQRPGWAAGKHRAVTTTLPPLAPADTRRIAELLLGEETPISVVDRICETAEGNPLYVEQLTAMLRDQGLLVHGVWTGSDHAEIEIPETLQALVAARLDRLDLVPRLILERASVEGRRFRAAAVRALAPDVHRDEVDAATASLERSGLVQPEDETGGRWRFAHALLLAAAYRRLSKGQRAELHEQLADWIAVEDTDKADVDELVARHLERALHLREELGMRDERSAALSVRAGALFAAAGSRAFGALDLLTSRDLLGRAAVLLPELDPRRLDVLPNLGVALTETGRDALRATIQLLSNRVFRSPTGAEVDAAVAQAEASADALARDDEVGLAEAAIAIEYLEFTRGCIARSHAWTLRALHHGLACGRFRESAQAAADVVGTAVFGPLPFDRFEALAETQLFPFDEPISTSAGHALMALGSLAAGDRPGFLEREQRWRDAIDRNGLSWLGAAHAIVIADVEIRVGDPEGAERRLRAARDILTALGDLWWVSALDSGLCAAVGAQDRVQEFLRLSDAFDASPAVLDRQILVRRSLLSSRALLLRGSAADAEVAARRGLELVTSSDLVLDHADALLTLADALDARGLGEDAATAREEAVVRLRRKGTLAAVAELGG